MPGCEWVLVVDCSQFTAAHPDFTGAQQVIGGEDGNVVGEQVFHRVQELAQVPRNAAERCGEPHCVTRLCRLAHALHGFLVEPGVDAVEDHHAVVGVRCGCLDLGGGQFRDLCRQEAVRPPAASCAVGLCYGSQAGPCSRPCIRQVCEQVVLHGYRVPAPGGCMR